MRQGINKINKIQSVTKKLDHNNHRFYVEEKGWVNAINLQIGDFLITPEGRACITAVGKERFEEPVIMYNFHVEEWASYFVSELDLYVHNGIGDHDGIVVEIAKSVERQAKKLSAEAKKGYDRAIAALKSGDMRGLNDHSLRGNRSGQRALDIKGTGKGRGAGRIIYEKVSEKLIKVTELLTNHDY